MTEQLQPGKRLSATDDVLCVPGILRMLGVRYNLGNGFWQRNAGELHLVYFDAKAAYRKAILKCHPDRGGSLRDATVLNQRWKFLKAKFKQRLGHL